jgi:predicted transcriptional regulator
MLQNEALQHKTRKKIYEHIADNPGISFNMLASIFDINEGTLRYHLDYLRRSDLISPRKIDNKRCFTCKDVDLSHPAREKVSTMNNDQKKVLELIREDPGLTRNDLLERSGLSRRQATRAISKLKEMGLIISEKEAGTTCYKIAEDGRIFNEMMLVLMEKYLREEISLSKLKELKRKLENML